MPKFSLFHKKKQTEEQKPAEPAIEEPKQDAAAPPQEEPKQEPAAAPQEPIVPPEQVLAPPVTSEPAVAAPEPAKETAVAPVEQKPAEPQSKTYLKAMPLKDISDLENIKNEVKNGNIIILRVTPLASKSIEDVKSAVNELYEFAESIGGDIARLGEERVVLCPKTIRIWREKSPAPVVSNEPLPTVA